ncbi:MAG TPA: hypothetical protein VL201_02485 [Patescibacteria group bacterium]|nr:hypothetical protein [Patescibacteria group bacterium]
MLILHSVVALAAGVIFGLFHYEYVLWQTVPPLPCVIEKQAPIYQSASIFYQKDSTWQEEKITIAMQELQEVALLLMQHWLEFLQEEGMLPRNIVLERVLVDILQNSLYISFDKSLFFESISTHQKTLIISSLAKTIASLQSSLQRFMLLVHHEPLVDKHIDCHVPFYIAYWTVLY